jgi:O-glycosyl hydrolase
MCRIHALTLLFCAASAMAQTAAGRYTVRPDQPKQTIRGLGFEIQSDSIGSDNLGLPDKIVAVPHDLEPAERKRFYSEMLSGFRYCRLAMGLYLRGTDPDRKQVVERYPGQMRDLKEIQDAARIEGFAVEYWSPTPYWKSNGKYAGGTLKRFDPDFLSQFASALVEDVRYLQRNGLKVVQWGLQNEPPVDHEKYSTCGYDGDQYYKAMKAVAPRIREAFPNVFIHADSWGGQSTAGSALIRRDPQLLKLVDGWTWHRIGADSNEQIQKAALFNDGAEGKQVFNNEFEYLEGAASDQRFVNTAQSIMNWFVFESSSTWFWLHALKPTYNAEASGYALGFWRPADDKDMSRLPGIKPGHWDYNRQNWNSLAGFLKYLPWDSVRLQVDEDQVRLDNRILAWKTPSGKLGVAVTNRSGQPFRFRIETGRASTFAGYRSTPREANVALGRSKGPELNPEVPDLAIEFWVERETSGPRADASPRAAAIRVPSFENR